jgi:hypothetical protein
MTRKWSSISSETSLTANISPSATSMVVNNVSGLLGGINPASINATDDFIVVLEPDTSNEEIVKVTGVAGSVLTITRAHDSSTAKTHVAGSKIRHMAIAEDFRNAAPAAAASQVLAIFLGNKASDPTLDNEGNALVAGQQYYNTTLNAMKVYNGTTWITISVNFAIDYTTFNTKGDLLVATANDVYTNLAAGANGLVLTTNSATATGLEWSQGLPSQTGNATYFLQTDGTSASWQAVVTDPLPSVFLMMGA